MTKKGFLEIIIAKKSFNEFEIAKLTELVSSLCADEIEKLSTNCAFLKFLNFRNICEAYFLMLEESAYQFAKITKIKDFKATRLQEKELLKNYFISSSLDSKPKWLKELYYNREAEILKQKKD